MEHRLRFCSLVLKNCTGVLLRLDRRKQASFDVPKVAYTSELRTLIEHGEAGGGRSWYLHGIGTDARGGTTFVGVMWHEGGGIITKERYCMLLTSCSSSDF